MINIKSVKRPAHREDSLKTCSRHIFRCVLSDYSLCAGRLTDLMLIMSQVYIIIVKYYKYVLLCVDCKAKS